MSTSTSTLLMNEEQLRLSTLLNRIIWSVAIIITLTFVIAALIQPAFMERYAWIVGIVCGVSAISLPLAKKYPARTVAACYIAFLMLMIFGFSWTGGGIRSHGMKILPVLVLLAGLTLGKLQVWVFGIIAALGGIVLVIADEQGWIPVTDPLGDSPVINWLYITNIIFLLCLLENFSVEGLRKALYKANREIERRKRSERSLQLKNEQLREVAFLQSHIVRKPVANVLGLVELVRFDDIHHPQNFEVIPKLAIAARELDEVIYQIVNKTHELERLQDLDAQQTEE